MLSQQSKPQLQDSSNNIDFSQQEAIDQSKKIGFTRYAETLNGRLAMLGFMTLLAFAMLNKHGVINPNIIF